MNRRRTRKALSKIAQGQPVSRAEADAVGRYLVRAIRRFAKTLPIAMAAMTDFASQLKTALLSTPWKETDNWRQFMNQPKPQPAPVQKQVPHKDPVTREEDKARRKPAPTPQPQPYHKG